MWGITYSFREEFDLDGCSVDLWRTLKRVTQCSVRKAHTLGSEEPIPISVLVSDAEADAIHAHLLNARVNVLPALLRGGFGGTCHELEISVGSFDNVTFCWWCELPTEWSTLAPAIRSLAAIIDASVGAKARVPAEGRRFAPAAGT